jgi:hypothetical protein
MKARSCTAKQGALVSNTDETQTAQDTSGTLAAEVRGLRQELTFLRESRMFVIHQSVPRILLFRFAVGMAVGLGTVVGATVLLSLIIWALSQIEFIPIIGEWSAQIAEQIEAAVSNGD